MMSGCTICATDVQDILSKAVDVMRDSGAEFADARSQTIRNIGVSTTNGELRQLVQKSTGGVCLRAWIG